jgi:hypothetical protein
VVATGATKERSYAGDYMTEGKRAEEVCMAFLRQRPEVLGLEDTRDLRVLQEADVDCAVHLLNGQVHLAEIKSDRHLGVSGNVLFEVLRVNHTCRPASSCTLGWAARSPAQWLVYYAPSVSRIYMGRFEDLRQCFQAYTREARDRTRLIWVSTDALKSTLSVLLPWESCKSVFSVYPQEAPQA